jgi:hypothetical protein
VSARLRYQLQGKGFTNYKQNMFKLFFLDDALVRTVSKIVIMSCEQSMTGMAARGGFEDIRTKEDVERLVNGILAGVKYGHEIGIEMWWIWAQKSED